MSFTIEYKTNPDEKDWSTMTLKFDFFHKNWDEDRIFSEIMEYVYTDPRTDDDEDYEENCEVKDMKSYINKVNVHFERQSKEDKENEEEFRMMS